MWESLLLLLKRAPFTAFMLPLWLLRGRAYLKRQIATHAVPDPGTLPYREEVLAFLGQSRSEGRNLVLATAADEIHARAIATHLGIFSDVLASDGRRNLSGSDKATRLTERFGARQFDYLGNDWVDVPSWRAAGRAIVVAAPARLLRYLGGRIHVESVLVRRPGRLQPVLRALRPHQWVKNLLVFVPVVAAHRVFDPDAIRSTLLTLAAFCLCASGIYVLNDLLDIHADRQHPRKRQRPFASGELSIPEGSVMSAALVASSLTLAVAAISWPVTLALVLYLAITTAYSVRLKREPVADVFVLAALYVLRILAGALAASIVLSTWLLAFAMFFFLSLAFVKRYTEVSANRGALPGRGYEAQDGLWMHGVGTSAGYMAVLVLALYVNAPEVSRLYTKPRVLWFLCPVLLYWLSRIWFRAGRRQVHDDPVVEALRDPMSYAVAVVAAGVLLAAM
jgi:4-hydroxybenzoate polyprenyltransferase